MDLFVEKIIERKKNIFDYMIIFSIFFISLFVALLILIFFNISPVSVMLIAALGYLVYYLISLRKIEYEYAFTNGELDIDKIIAQKKRKRIFSASCRDFEIFRKYDGKGHNNDIADVPKKIKAVTSMDSENIYFFIAKYKGGKTLVFFEPDKRMLDSLKPYVSKKMIL